MKKTILVCLSIIALSNAVASQELRIKSVRDRQSDCVAELKAMINQFEQLGYRVVRPINYCMRWEDNGDDLGFGYTGTVTLRNP